jgi:hypothetical protein
LALDAESLAGLIDRVRAANADLSKPPLPDAEVLGAARSAWRYKIQDRLMMPGTEGTIVLPGASISRLLQAGETDTLALLALLHKSHRRGTPFALAPGAMAQAGLIGSWGRNRYRDATRRAVELGELVQIRSGGRGPKDPATYRFGGQRHDPV